MNMHDQPSVLRPEDALGSTVGALESLLSAQSCNVGELLVKLTTGIERFAVVFSVLSEQSASLLREYILQQFPTNAEGFSASLSSSLIMALSTYFWRLSYPAHGLEEDHNIVERAPLALTGLLSCYLDPQLGRSHRDNSASFHQGKGRRSFLDPALLRSLGCGVPTSKLDAQEAATKILLGQKYILERYLHVLRDKTLRKLFQDTYHENQRALDSSTLRDKEVVAEVSPTPTCGADEAAPTSSSIEELRADLHNESHRAFGVWRIFLSSKADRDLRSFARKSFPTLKVIMKRIRELSNGQFRADNMKKLVGVDNGIPVYEARLPGDLRLVYCIHCTRDTDTDRENQVIRILGLYSHSQINKHFWDVVSRELCRPGGQYRKRCLPRTNLGKHNDGITLPQTFPPEPSVAKDTTPQPAFVLTAPQDKDTAQIAELDDVMSKFFELSKAILKSILIDEGGSYSFDLESRQQDIMSHHGSCYVLGGAGTGKTITMMFKMCGIQRDWEARNASTDKGPPPPRPRQMFVTKSQSLVEKVQEDFMKLSESLEMGGLKSADVRTREEPDNEDELFDLDEEVFWSNDLPTEFSALEDKHFPLFITYDHLCQLLEANFVRDKSFGFTGRLGTRGDIVKETSRHPARQKKQPKNTFVSYDVFLSSYWPHFRDVRMPLDPSYVFSEFMGVIKGSEEALKSPKGILPRDTYLSLFGKMEIIYDLFERYQKMKSLEEDFDDADRTCAILNALRKGTPGKRVDFIYIDEAQDNLLIDAPVIRALSNNSKGFFWAGDTTQTISAGSSFKFADLKSFLYRIETGSQDISFEREEPCTFQLDLNHRSHRGIVDCAFTLVEIIAKYWPSMIDSIDKERGKRSGPRPLFFRDDDDMFGHFFRAESARQCTIVRNESARDRLKDEKGAVGTILRALGSTIYESKGLEYDDILIYNFFEDSQANASQWRVVLNFLGTGAPCPEMDDRRHNVMCRELKSLYVAVTRARQNLWIYDSSVNSEPMHLIWKTRNQIECYIPGSPLPVLAKESSTEAWIDEGKRLFKKKQYSQAAGCFRRAGLEQQEHMSLAYDLRMKASQQDQASSHQRLKSFLEAATAFMQLTRAQSISPVGMKRYFRLAAECFARGGQDREAARAYEHAAMYEFAVRFYRRVEEFDELVRVLNSHRNEIPREVVDELYSVAKIYYLKTNQMSKAKALFRPGEDAAGFMGDYGFTAAQADVLEEQGNVSEAARIHQEEGRVLQAARLFASCTRNQESVLNAYQCLLDGLWSNCPLGTLLETMQGDVEFNALLEEIKHFDHRTISDDLRNQASMFAALRSDSTDELLDLAIKFHSYNNKTCCLRCLDHVFSAQDLFCDVTTREATMLLRHFKIYGELVLNLTSLPDPSSHINILKLLAIVTISEEEFVVPSESFLLRQYPATERLAEVRPNILRTADNGCVISRWDLNALIQTVPKKHLFSLIRAENEACRRVVEHVQDTTFQGFQASAVDRGGSGGYISPEDYHKLVEVHVLQIVIYSRIRPFGAINSREEADQRRFWLTKMYHLLNPLHSSLGSFLHLKPNAIPEFNAACRIVRDWETFLLRSLDRHHRYGEFMSLFLLLGSVRKSLNPSQFRGDFSKIPWLRPHYLPRLPSGSSVAYEALYYLKGVDNGSLVRGMILVRHILDHFVSIDVRILCTVLDDLCGSLIISDRLRRPHFHDITLPLSWWSRLSISFEQFRSKECHSWGICTKPLCALLRTVHGRLYSSEPWAFKSLSYLRFGTSEILFQHRRIVDAFLWRICRNLCILGDNFPYRYMQEEIRSTIYHIGGLPTHGICVSDTTSWSTLSTAFRRSASPQSSDVVVNIQSRKASIFPPPPGAMRCVYEQFEDLPSIISTIQRTGHPPAMSLAAPKSTPEPLPNTQSSITPPHDRPKTPEVISEESTLDVHSEDLDGGMDGIIQPIDVDHESEEVYNTLQIEMAKRIQRCCRKFLLKQNHTQQGNDFAKRARVFDLYYNASKEMKWSRRSRYRFLFLGPLTHIFLCVEWLRDHAIRQKKEAKKAMLTDSDEELEEVKRKIDQATDLNKKVDEIRRRLEPSSKFHHQRDVPQLQKVVLEVEELIAKVPPKIAHKWKVELHLGRKGIVAVPSKARKPMLNVEDL